MEPSSLQFLVRNKFDLNRLVELGVPYYFSSSDKVSPSVGAVVENLFTF